MKKKLLEYPMRTRFARDIVAEVLFPEKQQGKVVILCGGLPSLPYSQRRLQFFADHGYVIISPRYRGTWESGGNFLERSPFEDIRDIVTELTKTKKILNLESKKSLSVQTKKIYVIGVSFGGPAALLAASLPQVSKVVAISPVVDWRVDSKADPFELFVRSTDEQFGMAYRPAQKSDWQKLVKTSFYNPIDHTATCPGKKIFIIHAEDDEIVPIGPSKKFIEQVGGSYYWKRVGGHNLTMTHQFFWKKIEGFLKKK